MASIGKVAASLISASNENTLALASINFDFSLCKVEAPKEFRSISDSLTSQRRETAEDGALHQTARRLGSLFHDLIPKTPKLVQAYGQRASEISKHVNSTPKDKKTKNFGPFDSHLGLDASTIWAGATSGNSAIAIHLLACMLAHTWKGPEAISIWSELVTERKKEIERQCLAGDIFAVETKMVARQELRREDLANWDAGARAWLRSADRVKQKEQTQLMLIVKNVEIAVSNAAAIYPSVLGAWQAAMSGVENVLSGVPQRVQNGAVLLGLAAWHIFPDIIVLGKPMTEVHFGDTLVPAAGLLEIGLANTGHEDNRGVFWSLSLAHLRYYGAPVPVERSATYDESRVSFDQLYIVALGSIVTNWAVEKTNKSFTQLLHFIRILGEKLGASDITGQDAWLGGLVTAASSIMNATGLEAKYASLLFSYGRHQGKSLIRTTPTLFGLGDYSTLLMLAEDEDRRIAILRNVARALRIPEHLCIIRYGHRYLRSEKPSFEYASCKERPNSLKRKLEGTPDGNLYSSSRWIEGNVCTCLNDESSCLNCSATKAGRCDDFSRRRSEITSNLEECYTLPYHVMCRIEQDSSKPVTSDVRSKSDKSKPNEKVCLSVADFSRSSERSSSPRESGDCRLWSESIQHQKFYLVFGDTESAGLFVSSEVLGLQHPTKFVGRVSAIKDLNYNEIVKSLSTTNLRTYFGRVDEWMDLLPLQSLRALSIAAFVYQSYPNATFPLRICSQSLDKAPWIRGRDDGETRRKRKHTLTRPEIFSCLAYFESGTCEIAPDALEFVMAMSTGDTLYISECLLCDPAAGHDHLAIRRAMGNVGRPGVSMLVSPGTIQIRPQQIDSWMLIDPTPFDGTRLDSFSATSMHLTFTGYELPIGNVPTGGRDVEAALVETAVSVLDSGQWVADLDILSRKLSQRLCIFTDACSGFHVFSKLPERERFGDQMDCMHSNANPEELPFHSIDTWHGLLADLDSAGIVRTYKNRVARVVTAAVNLAKGREVYVLPDNCCWKCLIESFGGEGFFELSNSTVIIM